MIKKLEKFVDWGIYHDSDFVAVLTALVFVVPILALIILWLVSLYYSYFLTILLPPAYLYYRYRKEINE